jgi:hypothetical protein
MRDQDWLVREAAIRVVGLRGAVEDPAIPALTVP